MNIFDFIKELTPDSALRRMFMEICGNCGCSYLSHLDIISKGKQNTNDLDAIDFIKHRCPAFEGSQDLREDSGEFWGTGMYLDEDFVKSKILNPKDAEQYVESMVVNDQIQKIHQYQKDERDSIKKYSGIVIRKSKPMWR